MVANDLYPGSPGPIYGNEHMMMLDDNNQQIAQIIIDWASFPWSLVRSVHTTNN
jgi:hypothetical protein